MFPGNSLLSHLPSYMVLQSEHLLATAVATRDTKYEMHMEGPQYWQRPPTEPLVIRATLITLHFPCSDFFWVTDCLSPISNASWGHRSFHILVSMTFRGSFTPLLPRYGTHIFSFGATVPLVQSTSHCCCLPGPSQAGGHMFSPPLATLH